MRQIYIYETPASKAQGLIKIGDAHDVDKRIAEQLNTASTIDANSLSYTLLYKTQAIRDDGTTFRDHDIHAALAAKGYSRHQIHNGAEKIKGSTEWFSIDHKKVVHLIGQIKAGKAIETIDVDRFESFAMRPEQAQAVQKTQAWFATRKPEQSDALEMLWNAKMRFGKTFTAYQLAKSMGFKKVLVLTYKPAVEDAWQTDLESHVDFKDYVFLRRDSLDAIDQHIEQGRRVVAFASYQDLLGKNADGSEVKGRHQLLFSSRWDVVIVDEFHYGAGTKKAKQLLAQDVEAQGGTKKDLEQLEKDLYAEEDDEHNAEQASEQVDALLGKRIASDFRLYLSGTPFKAIADGRFSQDAIFNWTYIDEQRAKEQWDRDNPGRHEENPYKSLPQIQMYLYKVSEDLIQAGLQEGKDEFSLNHFFRADKNKTFANPQAVQTWLNLISGVTRPQEDKTALANDAATSLVSQYPFDHEGGLFDELDHTLWYMNRVDSAYAMRDALQSHAIFKHFHIILAAGKEFGAGIDAVAPVREAIARHDKTITLSVGKLTTGVSIPQWRAVMFLRDIASPENYFQTAFRAQTPFADARGKRKERCFIFDFSPNRSLRLLTTYSEKLTADAHLTTSERKIAEFVRYLPVLRVSGNSMISMDARDVLTFDLTGVDAKGLGSRFVERKNVVVTADTLAAINASIETQQRCQAIFDQIKMFRKYSGASESEQKDTDVNLVDLDVNDKKIKALKTTQAKTPKEEKQREKKIDDAEKAQKSEREKMRELLLTLLSRLPIFMYLTDATEENLEQVLIETGEDLFRKATGIGIDDFRFLVELGLLKIDSIDGYILRFIELENRNYEVSNTMNVLDS